MNETDISAYTGPTRVLPLPDRQRAIIAATDYLRQHKQERRWIWARRIAQVATSLAAGMLAGWVSLWWLVAVLASLERSKLAGVTLFALPWAVAGAVAMWRAWDLLDGPSDRESTSDRLAAWGQQVDERADQRGYERGVRDAHDAKPALPAWPGNSDRHYGARVALAKKSRAIRALLPKEDGDG